MLSLATCQPCENFNNFHTREKRVSAVYGAKIMTNFSLSDLSDAKVYVGTYAKYNGGSIFGKWLDLSDYSDKDGFYEACAALHKDEADPEYIFQDYEGIPDSLIGESWISDKVFSLLNELDDIDNIEAFSAFIDVFGFDLEKDGIDDIKSKFDDNFHGEFKDEEDFAYHIVEECYELPEFAQTYFDYEKFARDLFMGGYTYQDGYVFRQF